MIGAIELQPNDGPRSSLGIRPGLDIAVGPRWEFARRFAEGIEKLAGKKTRRLITGMSEAVGLMGQRLECSTAEPGILGFWATNDR
ncbi:hypothetical protein B296_00000661 [Ensete ventricosum]|uniref:Uncharacterized protein n=1 Tax=Ensete ventricosum TaxID=4639 RepID=A0A426ZIC1_ENSVE|nr:hypothetical protein B296_00000661 [Ensete ventricosum]